MKVHVWITTKEMALGLSSLLSPKLGTIQSKQHCCHVTCKAHKLSVTYVSFPAIVATSIVAVLQAPDDKNSDILFKCAILCISHESPTGKFKAHDLLQE